jgi:hypothetical protein
MLQSHRDEQSPPIPMACPIISLFLDRLDNLAKNLPHTIPEASDGDKLAEFRGTPADFDDKTVDNNLPVIQYHLQCLELEQAPARWVCEHCEASGGKACTGMISNI